MQIFRKAHPILTQMLEEAPVTWIRGARQVGKSTLALSVSNPNRQYLSLDDYAVLAAARSDPQAFILGLHGNVTIDEVQRVPELFRAIKLAIDQDRQPGRFLLTGSANVYTLPQAIESLAGRMQILDLEPLAQAEIEGAPGQLIDHLFSGDWPTVPIPASDLEISALWMRIRTGGFPQAVLAKSDAALGRLHKAYLQSILERDVREIADVSRLQQLPQLFEILSSRASNILNLADLARAMSLPASTLTRYLNLLEAVFLYRPLRAFHADTATALAKAPKVELLDTGLASSLLGLVPDAFESRAFGHLLENFVTSELRRQATWCDQSIEFSHFRTKHGAEVDLVLRQGQRIVGLEVKSSRKLETRDFDGLEKLREVAGDRWLRGVVFYLGNQVLPFGKFWAVPLPALWRW